MHEFRRGAKVRLSTPRSVFRGEDIDVIAARDIREMSERLGGGKKFESGR